MKHLTLVLTLAGVMLTSSLQALGQSAPPAVSSEGAWAKTAPLVAGRSFHTATLLPDGEVMVAGGCIEHDPLGVCSKVTPLVELFNPATEEWEKGKSMKFARFGHTATSLPDGRVLVVGGCFEAISGGLLDCAKAHRSAEIYDPVRKIWADAGEMGVSRTLHTAALISSRPSNGCRPNCGKVLVFGNSPDSSLGAGSTPPELYDPTKGTWAKIEPPNPVGGNCCTPLAVPLKTGDVLVVGLAGSDQPSPLLPKGSLLLGARDTKWRATSNESILRFSGSATPLNDGSVLVAGGAAYDRQKPKAPSAELYDPQLVVDTAKPEEKGGWRPTGRMSIGRRNHTATLLQTGEVLVAGGGLAEPINETTPATGNSASLPKLVDSAEIYDPRKATWRPAGKMLTGRGDDSSAPGSAGGNWRPADFTATRLKDGRVLVVGGAVLKSFDKARPLALQPKLDLNLAEIYQPGATRSNQPGADGSSRGGPGTPSQLLGDWRVLGGLAGLLLVGAVVFIRKIRSRSGR